MKIAWIVGALLAASLFAGVGLPLLAHADTKPGTITVQGNGSVDTTPDTATMTFGVTTHADTAAAALAANADAMTKVIAALKDAGIAEKDLQTQDVSVYQETGSSGYTASNAVSAIVRDVSRAGAVTDAAVAAGANVVSGPSLAKGDTSSLYRDALKQAFADAKAKAAALADAAGVSLGAVQSIVEGSAQTPVFFGAARAAGAPTPVEPGTQQ